MKKLVLLSSLGLGLVMNSVLGLPVPVDSPIVKKAVNGTIRISTTPGLVNQTQYQVTCHLITNEKEMYVYIDTKNQLDLSINGFATRHLDPLVEGDNLLVTAPFTGEEAKAKNLAIKISNMYFNNSVTISDCEALPAEQVD